jgi:hypothetical protein
LYNNLTFSTNFVRQEEIVPLQNLYSITPTDENDTFPERNIRFALLVHAMAQELYTMVPAAANRRADSLFGAGSLEKLEGDKTAYQATSESLRARCGVDIVSRTLAGGNNSVYLAKEFGNNLFIGQLQALWITQCAPS